jgi:hypothetical protein
MAESITPRQMACLVADLRRCRLVRGICRCLLSPPFRSEAVDRLFGSDLYSARKFVFSKLLSPDGHAGRQVSEIPVFQALGYAGRLLIDSITSCLATTRELNEDLYLRRSYLALFLNGTGYQESKLES